MDRTERNLWTAFLSEAKANRMYTAYAIKALEEGHPEVAEIFLEAAGAEVIHGLNHLQVLGEVRSTLENLKAVTEGEAYEFETMYPNMIDQAEAEGRDDAAASFRLALEGEKRHLKMFLQTLAALERKTGQKAPARRAAPPPPRTPPAEALAHAAGPPRAPETTEVFTEKQRIAALARIREVIFGMQDGLLTTATLGAAVAAATESNHTVVIAGLAGALGGMLSMSAGSFLGSRAEQQVHEAELAHESREIEQRPAEEMAELIEIYRSEGFPYHEAVEMAERVAADKKVLLKTMAEKELGLSPEVMVSPGKDALAMGSSYIVGGMLPLIPYFLLTGGIAVIASVTIAIVTLFTMGLLKGRIVKRNPLLSALEITTIGTAVAAAGYALGRAFPA